MSDLPSPLPKAPLTLPPGWARPPRPPPPPPRRILAFRSSRMSDLRSPIRKATITIRISSLQDGADDPRRELLFPHSAELALCALARRHPHHFLQHLPPHPLE